MCVCVQKDIWKDPLDTKKKEKDRQIRTRSDSPDELSVFRIIGIMNKDRRFLFLFYS